MGGLLAVGATTQLFGPIALLRHHDAYKVKQKRCLIIKKKLFYLSIIDLDAHMKFSNNC